jgi:hypothetical protein
MSSEKTRCKPDLKILADIGSKTQLGVFRRYVSRRGDTIIPEKNNINKQSKMKLSLKRINCWNCCCGGRGDDHCQKK